jgi:uncharacterized membrane protein YoaK (UPF0700 family)
MLKLDGRNFSKSFTLSLWYLMSFQAGYINVGGFIIFGNFVSHVTGTSSQIGMGVGSSNVQQIFTFVTILIAFITGAAFSGYFIGRRIEEGVEPKFLLVNGVKAALFGIILVLSEIHFLNNDSLNTLIMVFILSVCCGIQNSSCALATDGFLKPTHMTGLSTDVGINMTKIFAWKKTNNQKYQKELRKNLTRVCILFFFILGGVAAYQIFSYNGHYGFVFPFISSLLLFTYTYFLDKRKYGNQVGIPA